LYEAKLYPNFTPTFPVPSFTLYTTQPSEPTEAVKGKRKKYCSYVKKKEPI
jgi:hypothetical protein